MEWYITLLLLFGALSLLLLVGMPVAFSFMLVNIVGLVVVFGSQGLALIPASAATSIATFSLTPLPMFILMGDILARSGIARDMLDAVDKWIGRVPGRLSLITVTGGGVFAAMSGSSLASTAVLGSVLGQEMGRRGYKPPMSIGPVLGAAALSPLIPPSVLTILLAVQAKVDVGILLVMGLAAGLVMALVLAVYFVGRAMLQPHLAPAYDVPAVPLRDRILALRHFLVVLVLLGVVLGLIMTGTATPSESAALGAFAAAIIVVLYRRFTLDFVRDVIRSSATTSGMILMILVGSIAYSQLLAATGAGTGFVQWVESLPLEPRLTALALVGVVFILGLPMDALSMILITVPLFMPAILALGLDPLWFCLLLLICLEVSALTPPIGLQLYVLKGVMPSVSVADIERASWPITFLFLLGIVLFWLVPELGYLFVPST